MRIKVSIPGEWFGKNFGFSSGPLDISTVEVNEQLAVNVYNSLPPGPFRHALMSAVFQRRNQ